jgi:hypothetical protein
MTPKHKAMLMNSIIAYRNGNHVMLCIYKNASTSLAQHCQAWGWSRCFPSDIRWGEDRVLGVLQNPTRRWTKALTEDLWSSPMLLKWAREDSREFFKVLAGHVGVHCFPVTLQLGDRATTVDWILLDHPRISLERQLCLWLEEQKITQVLSQEKSHQSTPEKKALHSWVEQQTRHIIKAFINDHNNTCQTPHETKTDPKNYLLLMAEDIKLYRELENGINPDASCWGDLYPGK